MQCSGTNFHDRVWNCLRCRSRFLELTFVEVRFYPFRHIVNQQGCIHILRSQDGNTSSLGGYVPLWIVWCLNRFTANITKHCKNSQVVALGDANVLADAVVLKKEDMHKDLITHQTIYLMLKLRVPL